MTPRVHSLAYLAVFALLAGCSGPDPMRIHLKKTFEPAGFEFPELLAAHGPAADDDWRLDAIAENEDATVCVSQAGVDGIRSHYFKRHNRVICVLRGKGIAVVGGTRHRVGVGTTITVPKGKSYQFIPTKGGRYFAIAMFSPRYTGKGIKYLDKRKKKAKKAAPAKPKAAPKAEPKATAPDGKREAK